MKMILKKLWMACPSTKAKMSHDEHDTKVKYFGKVTKNKRSIIVAE